TAMATPMPVVAAASLTKRREATGRRRRAGTIAVRIAGSPEGTVADSAAARLGIGAGRHHAEKPVEVWDPTQVCDPARAGDSLAVAAVTASLGGGSGTAIPATAASVVATSADVGRALGSFARQAWQISRISSGTPMGAGKGSGSSATWAVRMSVTVEASHGR